MLDQTGVLNSYRINNEHISLFLQSGQMLKASFGRKMVLRSHSLMSFIKKKFMMLRIEDKIEVRINFYIKKLQTLL